MKKIKFKAIRDVKSPERDGRNAGYDLYVPKFTEDFLKEFYAKNIDYFDSIYTLSSFELFLEDAKRGYIEILPISNGSFNIKVPSGIKYHMEDSNDEHYTYMFKMTNKSGVASKNTVIVGACACDMEYRDEIIVNLIGHKPLLLKPDVKMVQGIIHRVEIPAIEFVPFGDDTDIFGEDSFDRGGGFNSTGNGL